MATITDEHYSQALISIKHRVMEYRNAVKSGDMNYADYWHGLTIKMIQEELFLYHKKPETQRMKITPN